jgi:hypothetical protein
MRRGEIVFDASAAEAARRLPEIESSYLMGAPVMGAGKG